MVWRCFWLLLSLEACRSPIVASTGERALSVADALHAYNALDADARAAIKLQPKLWVLDLLAEDALYDEARQRGVEPDKAAQPGQERAALVLALKRSVGAATMANVNADSLSDEDIMPLYNSNPSLAYLPPRCHASVVAFKDQASAEAFLQLAKTKKSVGEFRAAYWAQAAKFKAQLARAPMRAHPIDQFDVDLTHEGTEFPGKLVDACFSAPSQSVVGAFGGLSPRFDGVRHFVAFKMYQGEERNTYASAKQALREPALAIKQQNETLKQIRAIVERRVKLDEQGLATLTDRLR